MLRLRPMSAIETQVVSDEQLARSLGAGDAAAFDELYRRYARPLTAYAARLLGDQSAGEDVAQVTLLNAYQALRRGSEPLYVRAWLYRIAQNAAVEILSRRREHVEFADEHHGALDPQEVSAARGALVAALGTLPERQRRAYLLREVQGLRVSEIGNALALTTEQVEQALFAARNRLAEHLTFGDDLDCATARGLSTDPARHTETRALRRHLRSCGACRSATPRRGLRVGLFGPLSFLRDVATWLAGSGSATAPARLGAMAAAAALAVGMPALGGDTSSPEATPPRAPDSVVVPSAAVSGETPILIPPAARKTARSSVVRTPAASGPAQVDEADSAVATAVAVPEPEAPAAEEQAAAEAGEEAPVAKEPQEEIPVADGPLEEKPAEEVAEEDYTDGDLAPADEIDPVPDESSQGDSSPETESPPDTGTPRTSVAEATAIAVDPETVTATETTFAPTESK